MRRGATKRLFNFASLTGSALHRNGFMIKLLIGVFGLTTIATVQDIVVACLVLWVILNT